MRLTLSSLALVLTSITIANADDFCATPPCPCFQGDPCHVEMPARDIICLPGFYIGSQANGEPICSNFPAVPDELKRHYIRSKKTILDFEKQIIDNFNRAEGLKHKLVTCKKTRGRKC